MHVVSMPAWRLHKNATRDLASSDSRWADSGRDLRQNRLRWQNSENNEDITALAFHPDQTNLLLSGDDGGLVSTFDTSIAEEDEALMLAFDHGPIHKAGFVDSHSIYALSSDQNLALHPSYRGSSDDADVSPILHGDLRPIVPCEYVIDLVKSGGRTVVATGSHRYVFNDCLAVLLTHITQSISSRYG